MTDEEAFTLACVRAPEEDLPKLVFADWLEEQGRTREAWRIRQYFQVYCPEWKAAIQWVDKPKPLLERWKDRVWSRTDLALEAMRKRMRKTIRQVMKRRGDALWRLVWLVLFEAVQERYPLHSRPGNVAAKACHILLWVCGIQHARFETHPWGIRDLFTEIPTCRRRDIDFERGPRCGHDELDRATRFERGLDFLFIDGPAENEVIESENAAVYLIESSAFEDPKAADATLRAIDSLWRQIRDTNPSW